MTLLWALRRRVSRGDLPFRQALSFVPQLYLGLAFGGDPAGVRGAGRVCAAGGLAVRDRQLLWVTVYDTLYAMVDRDDDIKIGVSSTAILFGDSDRHIIAVLQAMTFFRSTWRGASCT